MFGLGMLFIIAEHLALGVGLRKAGRRPVLVAPAAGGGAGALVAVGVPLDPWHDLGLLFFELSWVAFGVHLVGRARHAVPAVRSPTAPGFRPLVSRSAERVVFWR
jgi:hypothetical protein